MMYQWTYGTPLSGLSFPLVTASGTYAKNYAAASLSATLSIDGGNWSGLGSRVSSIPGNGIYTIASLSSTEMNCYSWIVKITSNSGCLDQSIMGFNVSNVAILSAVSGLKNDVSGLAGILAAASGPVVLRPGTHTNALVGLWGSTHTSSQVARVTDLTNAGEATVDISSVAAQVWNTLAATYTSSTTFAGNVAGIYTTVSGIKGDTTSTVFPIQVAVSGLTRDVSGMAGILVAVSAIVNNAASGFAPILAATSTAVNLSSVAGQVWDTLRAGHTSSPTFGGMVEVSGLNAIMGGVSGLGVNVLNVSGLTAIMTQVSSIASVARVSGLDQILAAVSGLTNDVSGITALQASVSSVPGGVAAHIIDDNADLTSGTIAHTMRLLRWFSWEDLHIDKTYLPNRLYLKTDNTNYSSWFSLVDNVNNTERIRGG